MGTSRWALVTFDIDGTLTVGHGWVWVADRFGRRDAYDRTTDLFRQRKIGEDEHLSNLLAIAEGHTVQEVEAVLQTTPKMAHIQETLEELRRRGSRSALLTHNPGYVCEWYQRTFGFDLYEGCETPPALDGRIPPPGRVKADKLGSLERLLERAKVASDRVAHVGDSRSDLGVFRRVGGGVAWNSRIREVREGADATVDSEDLADVLKALDHVLPRPGPATRE